ncbi:helix-turn-helix domain-containing protein [Cyanobium sp. Alchichica 3B3-8F6]|uniref:helix-turn-helix domain-containing protein n=1 Tax=Synechococcales TaxID=1890424 RepID=UPI000B9909B0|nr:MULTISPECIES: helix-turn-helix transcriptional regulator [Synechococcales]MCP9883078.1 helix-turn-helix domain-containing protein [Cyanobium sp. Alchichica 3B3-8F6]MCP9940855.1 helix-turn-helix domain-containing protein [Cyanobium sp. ATX 6E8]
MGSTDNPALTPTPPLPPKRPRGRLGRWWQRGPLPASNAAAEPPADPLLAIGQTLRQRREERGLTLRQLALDTRISTAVLEALERGWRDRLPETTYLRTMVPLIERHLDLPAGSLETVLPDSERLPQDQRRQPLLRRFTPGNIDVFTTWQGTLLYGVLTLGLVYALNLQQQQLALRGLLAVRPIPPLPAQEQAKPPRPEQALLTLYPELRPLELAARGQGVAQLRRTKPAASLRSGLLELELSQPSQLNLESASGVRTSLRNASGSLSLPLSGGFRLEVQPAPGPGDRLSWNGAALQPVKGQPGSFAEP